jgi:hypothetical protein
MGGNEKEAPVALAWIWPALLVMWAFFLWELLTNRPKKYAAAYPGRMASKYRITFASS